MDKQYIAIDIGGTEIKHGVIDESGKILSKGRTATQASQGGMHVLKKAMGLAGEYLKKIPAQGICVSTAGMVDIEKGRIFYAAPLIPDYTGTEIKSEMEAAFQLPCEVENDVNCAGLAESRSGAAAGSSAALCLTVGTGIGGCVLLDGRVYHGFSNSACEVGYMHMYDSDFQTLGAASVLVKQVAVRKRETLEQWDGKRIFQEARAGDRVCIEEIQNMCDVLGRGIANICYVLNPEVVVLGGGVMAQEDYLREPVSRSLAKYLKPQIMKHTRVAFAVHHNDAGMLGAYYHFVDMQGRRGREWNT